MSAARLPGLLPLGPDLPAGFSPLASLPLLVLVGLTGVGKSTALKALAGLRPGFLLLPDRRELTDAVMIEPFTDGPVPDREQRFRLTARYRASNPGGMAQALGSLALALPEQAPGAAGPLLVFDGLRGDSEVAHAAGHFPAWRFVALHAPDAVRLRRLLGRADAFDRVSGQDVSGQDLLAGLEALEGVREVFGPSELRQLAGLAQEGYPAADILAKTRIVVAERRHYDPQAAAAVLAALPARRALELDTLRLGPAEVAARIGEWL